MNKTDKKIEEAKRKLINIMRKLDSSDFTYDEENSHYEADAVILELIEDEEVKKLYRDIPKWYA